MSKCLHTLRVLVGLAAILMAASCSHTLPTFPSPLCVSCDPATQENCVTFRVISFIPGAADLSVPSAPVFLSDRNGMLLLGHTPVSGEFNVPRSALLNQQKPAVLLFCWDHLSLACTAVRLDLADVAYWDTFNVTLPTNPLGTPPVLLPTGLELPVLLPQ